MKWIIYLAIFALSITSCSKRNKVPDKVTATLSANNRYVSVFIDSQGELWVKKGNIKDTASPSSRVSSIEISRKIKIDSMDVFFKQIGKLRAKPIKGATNIKDSPKTIVTYNGEVIYDAYRIKSFGMLSDSCWGNFQRVSILLTTIRMVLISWETAWGHFF